MLKKCFITASAVLSMAACGAAFANGGTMMPAPSHSIYVGIGGGYFNTVFNHHFSQLNTISSIYFPTITSLDTTTIQDTVDGLAPTVQAGYLQDINNTGYFWGVGGVYTYLGTSVNSGPYNAFLRTGVRNLFSLMALGGVHLNANNTATIGVGPAVGDVEQSLSASANNLGSFNRSATLWGGTAQIGIQHYFNPTWFVSANYSYTLLERKSLTDVDEVDSSNGVTDTFVQADGIKPTVQQVTLTLNHSFS